MIKQFLKISKGNSNTAIICDGKKYSYAVLRKTVFSIAADVDEYNDKIIGVYTDNSFYTYASILAVLLTKKCFIPLNSKFPTDKLKKIIRSAGVKKILCHDNSIEELNLKLGENYDFITNDLKVTSVDKMDFNLFREDETLLAYILFTSGSTGEPKGIPITIKNFNSLLTSLENYFDFKKINIILQTFELSFDVSLAVTFMALSNNKTLVINKLDGIIPLDAFKHVLDYNIDTLVLAPSVVSLLERYRVIPQNKLPLVTTTIFTGEALSQKTSRKWIDTCPNSEIYNAYGPTESTVWSHISEVTKTSGNGFNTKSDFHLIGKSLSEVKHSILKDLNSKIDIGELLLSGNQIFKRYWSNNIKTQESIIKIDGVLWYKTGDKVEINSAGEVLYINRLDYQVKINGYRVELGEVEAALRKQISSSEVVVITDGENSADNDYLIAFVSEKVNEDILLKSLRESLPFYMIPKKIIYLETFPLNSNGKIDRNALKKLS